MNFFLHIATFFLLYMPVQIQANSLINKAWMIEKDRIISDKQLDAYPESRTYNEDIKSYGDASNQFLGNTARSLFEIQADKSRVSNAHSVLGASANNAWKRYLNSFSNELPEWFEAKIEDHSGN